jgi:hypothetical protein
VKRAFQIFIASDRCLDGNGTALRCPLFSFRFGQREHAADKRFNTKKKAAIVSPLFSFRILVVAVPIRCITCPRVRVSSHI